MKREDGTWRGLAEAVRSGDEAGGRSEAGLAAARAGLAAARAGLAAAARGGDGAEGGARRGRRGPVRGDVGLRRGAAREAGNVLRGTPATGRSVHWIWETGSQGEGCGG
ncbi:hypothetical protein ABZP36_030844 [Zizania latifolia]